MITCRVLGPVSLEVDGAAAPPELLWRKHLALLVYLARSPRRARTREHLTGLLWPEKEESAARHSLNEALRVLRRAAGEAALDSAGGQLRLAEGAVGLDVDVLEAALRREDWEAAAAVVAGEFLEGFAVPGANDFEAWLAAERLHWRSRALQALLGLSRSELARGRSEPALAAARRAEQLDPHSDLAAAAVLTALAVRGDPAAALVHFERFRDRLAAEVGGTPSETTRRLAERIRRVRLPPASGAAGAETIRRAPLVGRGAELVGLLTLWAGCRAGGGATTLILEGDSGSGKTRLLEEWSARVRLDGGAVALVRAVEADRQAAGSGLLGLARGGLLDLPGLPAAPPAALAAFAREIPAWADRFRGTREPGEPPSLAQALRAVLEATLEAGPVLLVVDDVQWIDRESLLTLLALLRDFARAPLALAFAALPEPAREELDAVRHRLGHELPGAAVTLQALDGAALRRLAAWALPAYDAVALERVSRRVGSDSAGLPLLAVELLSAVAEGLELTPGTTWPEPLRTLSQSLPGDLPDTVIAAVRIGFRRLGNDAQQTLAAAAVLPGRVTESLLARGTGLSADTVAGALAELEWQRWLEADGQGYGFVANVVRKVVARDMLTPGQRARVLERAGVPPAA